MTDLDVKNVTSELGSRTINFRTVSSFLVGNVCPLCANTAEESCKILVWRY